MTGSPEYFAWSAMKQRCYNSSNVSYKDYGGRGITVCNRWLNSFENFYQDMGQRPSPDHSIDRKENDKGYYKDNCRWTTWEEQANNKRSNRKICVNDEEFSSINRMARRFSIPIETVSTRLNKNETPEQAINNANRKLLLFYNNKNWTVGDLSKEFGIKYQTLYDRIFTKRWSVDKSINTPVNVRST
jgi:hypothetical protein